MTVRAHAVELRLANAAARTSEEAHDPGMLEAHRENIIQSLGDAYLDACQSQRSRSWVECALRSTTPQVMASCE